MELTERETEKVTLFYIPPLTHTYTADWNIASFLAWTRRWICVTVVKGSRLFNVGVLWSGRVAFSHSNIKCCRNLLWNFSFVRWDEKSIQFCNVFSLKTSSVANSAHSSRVFRNPPPERVARARWSEWKIISQVNFRAVNHVGMGRAQKINHSRKHLGCEMLPSDECSKDSLPNSSSPMKPSKGREGMFVSN